ncbi:MAG: lysophospholipid acyltransferase family protein [Synergistaceae bacterium]
MCPFLRNAKLERLLLAVPQGSISHKREADAIVHCVYKHFGRAIAEFARIPIDAKNINKYVRVHGEEYLREAVEDGRGVVLATAHIGNWEYGGVWCAQNGYKVNALGTDQRDDRITKLIMDLRVAGGSIALGKANDLRAMMKALKAGEIIAVPVDQDARLNGVLSMFLGHPASTPVGIAKLAQKLSLCNFARLLCKKRRWFYI